MEQLTQIIQGWIADYGLLGLGLFAFAEAIIVPVPLSPLLLLLPAMGIGLVPGFLVALCANLAGALVAALLGRWLGHPVAVRIFGAAHMQRAEKIFETWGPWGVFVAAFTPIPFKLAAWCAGVFELSWLRFFIAALLGRALQFVVVMGLGALGLEGFRQLLEIV